MAVLLNRPYKDTTGTQTPRGYCETGASTMVEPETFMFLANLATNNRKAWMDTHREERDDALRNFTGIAMTLHDYSDRFDPYVAEAKIKPKQSYSKFFQDARDRVGSGLYRTDVDVFANAGNPTEDVGYYLHIEPGNCHAGVGLFQPTKPALARMRTRLVDDPQDLEDIVTDPEFKEMFPDGIVTRKALGAVPDGFDSNDPAAPYLKMTGLGCRKDLPDALLLEDGVIDLLIEVFCSASQLVRYFD
jgi:uncharacterized protein (TIGR02453 family)